MDNQRNTPINKQRSSTISDKGSTIKPDSRSPQPETMRTFSRQGATPDSATRQTDRKRSFGDRVAIDPRTATDRSNGRNDSPSKSSVNADLYKAGEIPDFVSVSTRKPMNPNQRPVDRATTFERNVTPRSANYNGGSGNGGRNGNNSS